MKERVFEPRFRIPNGAIENPYGIEQSGMMFWKNKRNGFAVAVCHYTADPEKRSEAWYREATKDLREDQRDREYEINFESRAGKKAFGYLLERPRHWQIPDITLSKIPKHWRIIAALDYGTQNPTSIHFYAIDDRRRFFSVFEYYKPSNVREIAAVLKGEHQGPNLHGQWTDYRHPLWKRCERVVVDYAIFKKDQDQGGEGHKSIGDLIEEAGIYNMESATKDRKAGLERVHDMLNNRVDEPEVESNLFFCKRCTHQWKELTELVYEELPPHLLLNKNQKEDVVAKNDHCFAAGTMISTPNADRPIEEIRKGDLVITRAGPRHVLASGQAGVELTYVLIFSNGSRLICTANHPIWTENRGFVRADELRYEDICLNLKRSFSMGSLFAGIQNRLDSILVDISSQVDLMAARGFFIEKFGNPIMEMSPTNTTYITRTGTRLITIFPIWNVFLNLIISASTGKSTLQKSLQPGLKIAFSQRDGIDLMRVENGTEITPRKYGITAFLPIWSAWHVALNLAPLKQILSLLNSVLINAGPRIDETPESTTSIFHADFAEKTLERAGSQTRKPVAVSAAHLCARLTAKVEPVFNLTVENEHEYFAEKILVSNSYDELRYALMSIQSPSHKPPEPKPGDGTLGAIEKEMDLDDDNHNEVDFF